MSKTDIDFTDPLTERKLTMAVSQKGFGIHPDRYFLYINIGQKSSVSFAEIVNALAIIHYEADIVIASEVEPFDDNILLDEDNIYLAPAITDELNAFLEFKSKAILTEEVALSTEPEELKKMIREALKRDKFLRDDTTKVYIYKIATKHNNK